MKMRTAFISIVILLLTACAPAPVVTATPLPTLPPATEPPTSPPPTATPPVAAQTETASPTATLAVAPSAANTSTSLPPVTGIYNPYAVVLVLPDDVLNIRSGAGVENAIVGPLQPAASGVNRTGPASSAGGERWVEIQNPNGGTGWVNANFLTEDVTSSTFCGDSRVAGLLTSLETAILNSNGELLSSLVSPVHGLELRLWRYGTVANYSFEEAAWVFQSEYVVSWGAAPGSGEETLGTFSEQPLPKLQEVLGADYSLHCNDPLDLATHTLVPWPPEYDNINFYTIYKPGTDEFGGLDWRAWIAGVEYVQGEPTLFALINFQWEP